MKSVSAAAIATPSALLSHSQLQKAINRPIKIAEAKSMPRESHFSFVDGVGVAILILAIFDQTT